MFLLVIFHVNINYFTIALLASCFSTVVGTFAAIGFFSMKNGPRMLWNAVNTATHPIHFAADSPDKIHRYAAWAVFFF